MPTRERRQQGYSLIEVLVAFVILAMSVTVLLRIFASGLRNVDAAAEYARAVAIADAEIAAPGLVSDLQPGLAEGYADDWFHWRRSISRLDPESLAGGNAAEFPVYHIAVTVEWPARNGTRQVEFETLRLERTGRIAP